MPERTKYTDILVECNSPQDLDRVVQAITAAAVIQVGPGNYLTRDGAYVVRCFGDPDFLVFAINKQGYGKARIPES